MNKNRILSLLLAAAVFFGALPMVGSAAEPEIFGWKEVFSQTSFPSATPTITLDQPLAGGIYKVYVTTAQSGGSVIKTELKASGATKSFVQRTTFGDVQYKHMGTSTTYTFKDNENKATIKYRNTEMTEKFTLDFTNQTLSLGTNGEVTQKSGTCKEDDEGYLIFYDGADFRVEQKEFAVDAIDSISLSADSASQLKAVRIEKAITDGLEADMEALTIDTILNGQDYNAVTEDLNLPDSLTYGTQVSWTAEPAGIIDTTTGAVTRPADDTWITLTANLTASTGTAQAPFRIKVIGTAAEEQNAAAVVFDKAVLSLPPIYGNSGTVELPSIGAHGSAISWESDSAVIAIAADGYTATVTNPSGEENVTLTATLKKGSSTDTKPFDLTVAPVNNLALGKPATADRTVAGDTYTASKLTDGNRSTRWAAPSGGYPFWAAIDLETPTECNRMVVYEFKSRVKNYTVQTSDDGQNWTDVISGTTDNPNANRSFAIDFPAVTAQYFRLYMTDKHNPEADGPTIFEIELYNRLVPVNPLDEITAEDITNDPTGAVTAINSLPQTAGGRQVTWLSSNTDLYDPQTGILTQPSGADEAMKLYAVADGAQTKEFLLNIKGLRQGLHYFADGEPESESVSLLGGPFYADRQLAVTLQVIPEETVSIDVLDAEGVALFTDMVNPAEYTHADVTAPGTDGVFLIRYSFDVAGGLLDISVNGIQAVRQELLETDSVQSLQVSGGLVRVDSSTAAADAAAIVKRQLSFGMLTQQDAALVKDNLNFSEVTAGGVELTWGDSAGLIGADGAVSNPAEDALFDTTLTCTIQAESGTSETAAFPLKVVGIQKDSLAYGKAVRASAAGIGVDTPDRLTDGSSYTPYRAAMTGKTINLDINFAEPVRLGTVEIMETKLNDAYGVTGYTLYASDDAANWTELASGSAIGEKAAFHATETIMKRYLRLSITGADKPEIAIGEIYVAESSAGGGAADPEYDLERIAMPEDVILKTGFAVPVTGATGGEITVATTNPAVTTITKGTTEYSVAIVHPSGNGQNATITVTCKDPATGKTAQKNRLYYIEPTGSTSRPGGGSGGGSGSNKGGGSYLGTGAVTPPVTGGQDTTPITPKMPFADVTSAYSWAADSIRTLKERGIVTGDENGNFNPGGQVTREELLKMLVMASGAELVTEPVPFEDVDADAWYFPYVSTAYHQGIINGISETVFGIGEGVSRQDVAVMIDRQDGGGAAAEPEFTDAEQIAPYAAEAVARLAQKGILSGDDSGSFRPTDKCTRAEMAKVVCAVLGQEE